MLYQGGISSGFDIPYLVKRIKQVLGDHWAKRLSPWGIIEEKTLQFNGKDIITYRPAGVAVLDYLPLYKKYTFRVHESYKLDNIAEQELNENKIDYSEYGTLQDLYEKNVEKYYDYNIHDCTLVKRLEDKLGFIQQVIAVAYIGGINYEDTYTTVRPWDVIIHNFLMDKNTVINPKKYTEPDRIIMGGFVKEPEPGLYGWGVTLDLDSLYPHLMMMFNISPDTFLGMVDMPPIDDLAAMTGVWKKESMVSYTAIGAAYTNNFRGFLAELMDTFYTNRKSYKDKMKDTKKRFEKTKNFVLEKEIAKYHNMQLALKIFLNSCYGAMSNPYFRWFNNDIAESITSSGQVVIKYVSIQLNKYMNKLMKTTDIDYVIMNDTDSAGINMQPVVDKFFPKNISNKEISRMISAFCKDKIQPFLEQIFEDLSKYMNAYEQKMRMKQDIIYNKAIFASKKHYVMNVMNEEGLEFDEPKLKIVGLEAIRSSTPKIIREELKSTYKLIFNTDEKTVIKHIENFRKKYSSMSFETIAKSSTANNLRKYSDSATIYKSACPFHVKGALIYNNLLKERKLDKKFPLIQEKDKIKVAYLKVPNPIKQQVISAPENLPKELDLDKYIDYDKMFDKNFYGPIEDMLKAIGWKAKNETNLSMLFGK